MLLEHRVVRKYGHDAVGMSAVISAAERRGFRIVLRESAYAKLKAGLSWYGAGEIIEAFIGTTNEACIVDVRSRPVLWTTIVDYGKNERNVRCFFRELDAELGACSQHEEVTVCADCGYAIIDAQARRCPECGASTSPRVHPSVQWRRRLWAAGALVVALSAVEYVLFACLEFLGVVRGIPHVFGSRATRLVSLLGFNGVVVFLLMFLDLARRAARGRRGRR